MPYATRDDVFNLGLSALAFVARARPLEPTPLAAVDLATGVIRLKAHGLSASDLITLEVTTGGTLATGLSAFVPYTLNVVSFDLLRIVNPSTGLPFTSYVSAGAGWSVAVDPLRRIDVNLVDTAATIDDKMTAHLPPFLRDPITGLYAPVLVGLNARLTALAVVTTLQFENASARVAVDRLEAQVKRDWENLATYLAGRPIQPRPTDQNDAPDNAPRAYSGVPVAWSTGFM